MPRRPASAVGTWIFATYLIVAMVQAWPLPLHLSSHLTGPPSGDTGVYVWNTWVFRHELVDLHHSPFLTESVLPLDGPTDLSLHNYTVFADLLALPLQPLLGVVATFNVIYLINVALAGFGMFLLARDFGRDDPAGTLEAWLAGLLFCCSPFLVARSTAHFSLAAAAPLPFFIWFLDRTWRHRRALDAIGTGACVAWAGFSDPYYAIYCLMLGLCVLAPHVVTIAFRRATPGRARLLLDVPIAALLCLIVGLRWIGQGSVQVGAMAISMRSLYTPVMLLTVLGTARVLATWRPSLTWTVPTDLGTHLRTGAIAVGVAALLLAPELYAIGVRAVEGRLVPPPVMWRSSAPGVDLISFFLPNPGHPLVPSGVAEWLARQPNRYEENVASLPWVALITIVVAWRVRRQRPDVLWLAITLGFAALTLGPFLQVAGTPTYVPTPWVLLRYAPIIGEARMPPRFAVIVVMALAMLFAGSVRTLAEASPARRRAIGAFVGVALAFELWPVPRTLYSAEIPLVYQTIAADPRPIRVLELPFGIRDGLSSLGDFSASSQFFQTLHGKELLGGYLSRVEDPSKAFHRADPVLQALLDLSEHKALTAAQAQAAAADADAFIARARLGYVVMDDVRVDEPLRRFALDTLGLRETARTGAFVLYVPRVRP
jgi:hypothetical protein